MKREIVSIAFVLMLFVSMLFSSLPLVSAAYTVEYPYMPPDLVGDCNTDGHVNSKDAVILGAAFGSKPGDSNWDPRADLNRDGYVNAKDSVILSNNFGNVEGPPIAYSTTFTFTVSEDGDEEVWYYILARVYVPSELSGQNFYFVATADDSVQNIKLDAQSKAGSGSSVNIDLGSLNSGYHLLEFELIEIAGAGSLNFHIATATEEYSWLVRFRIYVPDYNDNLYNYTVRTNTNFMISDNYFIKGYADDFVDHLKLGGGLLWQDWEWDTRIHRPIHKLYPIPYLDPPAERDIEFTFGEIENGGLLDFQIISWAHQQDRIGNPRFWTKASVIEATPYIEICEAKAFTGSKWISDPGRSVREISTTLRVLTNTTDPDLFIPAPQEAEVSLILTWLDPLYDTGSLQDIGVMINLTYTYFIEESMLYGMPIWFDAYSIDVRLTEQGNALFMPSPALVFNDVSERSFISPEWKVVGTASGMLINFFITSALYYQFGPAGAIAGITIAATTSQLYNFFDDQDLVAVQENPGTSTYRNFIYTDWFKTAESQEPLSPSVRSVCEGFFFRVYPTAPSHCGLISIDLKGYLYLPYFYVEPETSYGTWLPVQVELQTSFPVFIMD